MTDYDVNTVIGPSEEELFQRQGDDICLERGRRRRRREEGQRWEERLQENWENCLVGQRALSVCIMLNMYSTRVKTDRRSDNRDASTTFLFSGVKSVLPGLG